MCDCWWWWWRWSSLWSWPWSWWSRWWVDDVEGDDDLDDHHLDDHADDDDDDDAEDDEGDDDEEEEDQDRDQDQDQDHGDDDDDDDEDEDQDRDRDQDHGGDDDDDDDDDDDRARFKAMCLGAFQSDAFLRVPKRGPFPKKNIAGLWHCFTNMKDIKSPMSPLKPAYHLPEVPAKVHQPSSQRLFSCRAKGRIRRSSKKNAHFAGTNPRRFQVSCETSADGTKCFHSRTSPAVEHISGSSRTLRTN